MFLILYIVMTCFMTGAIPTETNQERPEVKLVAELFRLRNEHKADSAEHFYADTVLVYMKYLRNIPKSKITQSDKNFWKAHPNNKFEMTDPIKITVVNGITTATIIGKEYLDGKSFQKERIVLKFDRNQKINYYRGFSVK